MSTPGDLDLLSPLAQRLHAATEVACDPARGQAGTAVSQSDDRARTAAEALTALLETAAFSGPDVAWLTLTALRGQMPTSAQVVALHRTLRLEPTAVVTIRLLDETLRAEPTPELALEADVVSGVVVYADSSSPDGRPGERRVVASLIRRWADVALVTHTGSGRALRTLDASELTRLGLPGSEPSRQTRLVVPWGGVVVVPELVDGPCATALAALGEHSGNRLASVGYDMVPLITADTRPIDEVDDFGRYLTAVKHATTVAATSASARQAFAGFTDALAAQGLTGPAVVEVPLPCEAPRATAQPRSQFRTVVCLGSHEPHKNHDAVLFAAQVLWAQGHQFTLELVGRPGRASDDCTAQVAQAQAQGRHVLDRREVDDDERWRILAAARFAVLVPLDEGADLHVAESLACGTPVITSTVDRPSGGCLAVDPRGDQALVDAMRRLLVDDSLVDSLASEASARPVRTWDDFADEMWAALVAPTGPGRTP